MNTELLKKERLSAKKKIPVFAIEEQFKLMANSAPILLWVSGLDTKCSFFNRAWLNFTGKKLEEEFGDGWMAIVHPDDRENCKKVYKSAFEKQRKFKMEFRLRRKDGQYRWMQNSGIPHFSNEKEFLGFIGTCVDIHELKEIEHSKDQFIIAASHELKTPLTTLNIYLQLLADYFKISSGGTYGTYVSGAMDQVKKINDLINQLLDLSRIQSGHLDFEYTVFSFEDLVLKIAGKMQAIMPSHKIVLTGKMNSLIKGDAERISQSLENLLSNASKYSKEESEIHVNLSEDEESVMVTVTDFGKGIDKQHLSKIFERFYRIPGKKEDTYPGLGIGLYLSQQIIKKHGGKITVESILNKETTFVIQIPIFKKQVKINNV